MNTTLTNDQITAGAAVLCDHGQPIGRNAAIAVFDAMRAASPQVADIAELPPLPKLYEGRYSIPELAAKSQSYARDAIAASRRATCLVPMRDDTFTVIPPNMREYPMSVREADMENDLFRVAFDDACKEDKPENAEQELFAWDFFRYGWEAAVRLLNDDAERAAAQGTGEQ